MYFCLQHCRRSHQAPAFRAWGAKNEQLGSLRRAGRCWGGAQSSRASREGPRRDDRGMAMELREQLLRRKKLPQSARLTEEGESGAGELQELRFPRQEELGVHRGWNRVRFQLPPNPNPPGIPWFPVAGAVPGWKGWKVPVPEGSKGGFAPSPRAKQSCNIPQLLPQHHHPQ